jgi:hypothetical protein
MVRREGPTQSGRGTGLEPAAAIHADETVFILGCGKNSLWSQRLDLNQRFFGLEPKVSAVS